MAEAVTSQSSNPKFYCYTCNEEVDHVRDFLCPICNGGFIEEVQETPGGRGTNTPGSDSSSTTNFDFGGGSPGGFDFLQLLRGLSDPTGSGGGSGGGGRGGGPTVRFQTSQNPANFQRTRSEGGSTGSSQSSVGGTNNPGGFSFVLGQSNQGRGGRSNPNLENPMEHVLFTFLNDLIHGLGGSGAVVGGQGTPLLSNIGDYAWGRDGLDSIVTQLMNQMEGTGPPPLATDKIDTLPDVKIRQDQVDRKLQCSVCWDDFNVGEAVKQLECDHVYHPDCIIPWLKLHGTCPICRKDLTGQIQEGTNDTTPSTRFEPMAVDSSAAVHSPDTTSSSNLNTASSNASLPHDGGAGTNSAPSGRNHQSSSTTARPPSMSNPFLQFLTEFTDPGTNNASNNQPNPSGRRQQGADQRQLPQRDRGQRGPEHDFDNMDFEFD